MALAGLLLTLLIGGTLFSVVVYAVLWFVERDRHIPFTTALGLGFGIKLASSAIILILGMFLGPFVLAPVFFAAWGILHRYGRLSERHAAMAVALLVLIELGVGAVAA